MRLRYVAVALLIGSRVDAAPAVDAQVVASEGRPAALPQNAGVPLERNNDVDVETALDWQQAVGERPAGTDDPGSITAPPSVSDSRFTQSLAPEIYDLVFVLDESGSVSDDFDFQQQGLIDCLCAGNVPADGTVAIGVILFADEPRVVVPLQAIATAEDLDQLCVDLAKLRANGGGTEILPALEEAEAMLVDGARGSIRHVLLSTDADSLEDPFDLVEACEAIRTLEPPVTVSTALLDAACPVTFMEEGANTFDSSLFEPEQPRGTFACLDVSVAGGYEEFCEAALCGVFNDDELDCDGDGVPEVCHDNVCHLFVVGQYDTEDARDVVVLGSLAYVADSTGLLILDVSDPAAPKLVGSYETRSEARAVTRVGPLAYVATSFYGLEIVSVADPTSPFGVGSIALDGVAEDVVTDGNIAFVAGFSRTHYLDVSVPTAPVLKDTYVAPSNAVDANFSNEYVYVAGGRDGVLVLRVLPLGFNLAFVNDYTATISNAVDVMLSPGATHLYVADAVESGANGVEQLGIGAPGMLSLVDSWVTPGVAGVAEGLFLNAGTVYLADGQAGLWEIPFPNPSPDWPTGYAATPGLAHAVDVHNGLYFVADGSAGLTILKCGKLCSPIPDINSDGAVNILDFIAFQAAFTMGLDCADCDGTGSLNILDFVCFQSQFGLGCP